MADYRLIATAPFGLESVVAKEVNDLGYPQVTVENGRVLFSADAEGICRANLWLRTADRVRVKVGEFSAVTFEELFQGAKSLPWPDILPQNAAFPVQGKSIKSQLFSVSDCQAVTKKAVVESLKSRYNREQFPEDGPLYPLEVALWKDTVTITMDTSGAGLHKRGYREQGGESPLQETLAAGMIILSRWEPSTALLDPFCGSGTIPIEAALLGMNIAPGLNRSFAAESWPQVPQKMWDRGRQEAKEKAFSQPPLSIGGSDAAEGAVSLARRNAARAGVAHALKWEVKPVQELFAEEKYGKIICNPPYGERSGESSHIEPLYREMGKIFLERFSTWSVYLLSSVPGVEKLFGKKASKRRKLYNGRLEVHYYQYFGPRPPQNKPG